MSSTEEHRFSIDSDTCVCGGQWVYFDDDGTHGCEVAGPFLAIARNVPSYGFPLDHLGEVRCQVCGSQDRIGRCDGYGATCETCSLDCPCDGCQSR